MSAMLRLCFFFLIPYVLCETTQYLQTCTSCGPECVASCGSRNFRTCCYNYLKKRSSGPPLPPQDSKLRGKLPWLTTLFDGALPPRSSGAASDRDVQVQLFLSPDWLSPDSLNHYRDLNENYQENQVIGRLVGLSDIQPTEVPVSNGSNDSADTSVEGSNGETSQGLKTNDKGRHQPPTHWISRHQHQRSTNPWSEVNRRLPIYGA